MRKLHTPCRSGQKRRWIDPHRVQLWPRGRGMLRKQPRRRKFPCAALMLLLLIVAGCTFAAWLTPYEVSVMDGQAISLAPCLAHPLGTDSLGRDLLTMILYGGRLSLYIGLLSALLSSLLALVYGAISGLAPGALDALLMRFCELLMSLPSLILVLFLQAVWGKPTPTSIAVVLALTSWMTLAKLVRSEVRRIRESDYILSAKIMGADFTYLLQKHLLPNLISPAMFMVVSSFGQAIIAETTLSFLGLGLPVSQVSWGSLLSLSKNALLSNQWWMILLPGLVLVTTLVCITELGEYARARNNRLQSNL